MARGLGFGMAAALLVGACSSPSKPPPRSVPAPAAAPKPVAKKPAWQARRVVADAVTTPQGRIHTVKPGETGIAIARAYNVSWAQLVALNDLKPPYILEIGDKLRLPTVRQVAAQTPEERARAFSLDIDDIITGGEPAAGGKIVAAAPQSPRPQPPARRPRQQAPTPAPAPLPVPVGDAPAFRWPVEGRVLSAFGAKPGGRFNDGVNLKASAGAPVRAAADGIIAYAGDAIPGFGNLVLIKHAGGWVTAYGHNEALLVTRGGKVAGGDVIARAGATGAVTEPQVHFELRRGRTPVDPVRVIGGK